MQSLDREEIMAIQRKSNCFIRKHRDDSSMKLYDDMFLNAFMLKGGGVLIILHAIVI